MFVFGAQPILLRCVWPDRCDVDEQTSLVVDPPRINDIQIVLVGWIGILRIDFEHVIALFIGVDRHVVVFSEEVDSGIGHLDIDIRVPRQYLDICQNLCLVLC